MRSFSNGQLKKAFHDHLRQTQQHVNRLEQAFQHFGYSPSREACEAMKGLIAAGDEIISADGDQSVKDAALIAAARLAPPSIWSAVFASRQHSPV
jgi:ferritin-like metal-binding protein YciE